MGTIPKSILEAAILGLVGIAVATGANTLRGSGSLEWNRNYFDKGMVASEHAYQTMLFEEVVEIFNDPATQMGANVFIDARNDELYEEGHIPGALQADHYRLEDYIENVLAYAESADRIIVYCNGGDCEDSIYMCTDLVELDVPYDRIYLYVGGWKEWESNGQPVATGREE